jgi:hypothetical protein
MSRRLIIRTESETDIVEAAIWYEGRERGLGLEVTGEIHAAMARASQNPLAYLLLRERPHVRRILVRRFPWQTAISKRQEKLSADYTDYAER